MNLKIKINISLLLCLVCVFCLFLHLFNTGCKHRACYNKFIIKHWQRIPFWISSLQSLTFIVLCFQFLHYSYLNNFSTSKLFAFIPMFAAFVTFISNRISTLLHCYHIDSEVAHVIHLINTLTYALSPAIYHLVGPSH